MKKYFFFILFILNVIYIKAQILENDSTIIFYKNYELNVIDKVSHNILYTVQSKLNIRDVLSIDNEWHVFNHLSNSIIKLTEIDSLYNDENYNNQGSLIFPLNNEIFCVGGYGYWNILPFIRKNNTKSKWEPYLANSIRFLAGVDNIYSYRSDTLYIAGGRDLNPNNPVHFVPNNSWNKVLITDENVKTKSLDHPIMDNDVFIYGNKLFIIKSAEGLFQYDIKENTFSKISEKELFPELLNKNKLFLYNDNLFEISNSKMILLKKENYFIKKKEIENIYVIYISIFILLFLVFRKKIIGSNKIKDLDVKSELIDIVLSENQLTIEGNVFYLDEGWKYYCVKHLLELNIIDSKIVLELQNSSYSESHNNKLRYEFIRSINEYANFQIGCNLFLKSRNPEDKRISSLILNPGMIRLNSRVEGDSLIYQFRKDE